MHFSKRLIPVFCAALFFSCTREATEAELPELEGAVRTKVVCLSSEIDRSSFFVKFAEVPSGEQLQAIRTDGVADVVPLFVSRPGKEELEARFGLDRWFEVILTDEARLDDLVSGLSTLSSVSLVEYNAVADDSGDDEIKPFVPSTRGVAESFNDPYLDYQWDYINTGKGIVSPNAYAGGDINVKDVWAQITCGDPSIIVAVVDHGVKYTHPDLKDNMWVNTGEIPGNGIDDDGNGYKDDVYGYNFVDNNAEINWNTSGHGTHCAGTIAAVNNNGKGVVGIAGGSGKGDGCRIMTCQIFSDSGGGSVRSVANAVKYAADNGASVISCSFGYSSPFTSDNNYKQSQGSAEIDAVHYFEASKNNDVLDGNIAIFAAGNEGQDFAHYPGAFYDIISVSALGPDFLPTYYTNYGPGCNIAAPGGEAAISRDNCYSEILSTVPSEVLIYSLNGYEKEHTDYGYMQGTSMACPHVSGVVALALSYAHQTGKKFTRDAFKQMILASTRDIDQRISKATTKTYAYTIAPLSMAPFYHQMGTGAIDAWSLMMHIDGIPCSTVTTGKSQWVSLDNLFGTSSVSLTYLGVEVPEATVSALGLQKIQGAATTGYPAVPEGDCYAYVQFGRLYVHPTKAGAGKITIKAVGGGDHVGGGNNPPGGMEVSEQISLIAREVDGGNGTGGWL